MTEFASDVYNLINAIPEGKVLTYGAIATLLGRPGNSRLVGKILSDAPAGVRAHRVVNAAGRTAPGWDGQRGLLEGEGVAFRENGTVDLKHHIFNKINFKGDEKMAAAKKGKTDRRIRIGIIGTGGIAHSHMRAYMSMDDVDIVGGADIVPGKARAFLDSFEKPEAKAFEGYRELLKLGLDGVSVCTYNSTHAECSIGALEAGVNVLCEKPMSVTLDDAAAMVRAQKAAGKVLTIGFQPRYDPDMLMVRDLVKSGVLGRIYYVQTGGGRRRGMPGGTFIRKELAGMGALGDIGCYGLDMAMNAIGYPKPLTVSAYASNFFGTNPKYSQEYMDFKVDDFSVALIRLEGDIALDFRMSWAMHMDSMGDTLFLGTDAGLKVKSPGLGTAWGGAWDGTIGPVYLYSDINDNLAETQIPLKNESVDRFRLKVRAFVDAVKSGGPDPIPASQILYNQAIIDGIMRSSEAGREVAVKIPKI